MKKEKWIKKKPKNPRPTIATKKETVLAIENKELKIEEASIKFKVEERTIRNWVNLYGNAAPNQLHLKQIIYSDFEKRQIVYEFHSGKLTANEILKKYGLTRPTLRTWCLRYLNDITSPVKEKSVPSDNNLTPNQDSLIKSLNMKIMALETMIDIAEQEYNLEIRKKSGSKQ